MVNLWMTGDIQNSVILYSGGLCCLVYLVSLSVSYSLRRHVPVVISLHSPHESGRVFEYILVVKTSLLPFSGCCPTTSVSIQLRGQFHNSKFHLLRSEHPSSTILTSGAVDVFILHLRDDLGDLQAMGFRLSSDNGNVSKWRLGGIEVYTPASSKVWSNNNTCRLICHQHLESYMRLYPGKTSQHNLRWLLMRYTRDLWRHHQWCSLAMSFPRFGIFTPMVNLVFLFLTLVLFFTANLVAIIVTDIGSDDIHIGHSLLKSSIIGTLTVVIIVWILEGIIRNSRPSRMIAKDFVFRTLQGLKEEDLDIEASCKLVDVGSDTNLDKLLNKIEKHEYVNSMWTVPTGLQHKQEEFGPEAVELSFDPERFSFTSLGVITDYETETEAEIEIEDTESGIVSLGAASIYKCLFVKSEDLLGTRTPIFIPAFGVVYKKPCCPCLYRKKRRRRGNIDHYDIIWENFDCHNQCQLAGHYAKMLFWNITYMLSQISQDKLALQDYMHELIDCLSKHFLHEMRKTDAYTRACKHYDDHLPVRNCFDHLLTGTAQHCIILPDPMVFELPNQQMHLPTCDKKYCDQCLDMAEQIHKVMLGLIWESLLYVIDMSKGGLDCITDSHGKELKTHIVKKLAFFVATSGLLPVGISRKYDDESTSDMDLDLLLVQCVAAVVDAKADRSTVDLYDLQAEQSAIALEMKQLASWSVTSALLELENECLYNVVVEELCGRAVNSAQEELSIEFQDHVHLFALFLLQKTLLLNVSLISIGEKKNEKRHILLQKLLLTSIKSWHKDICALPMHPEFLLVHSFFAIYSKKRHMNRLFQTTTEFYELQSQLMEICRKAALKVIPTIMMSIKNDILFFSQIVQTSIAEIIRSSAYMYLYSVTGKFAQTVQSEALAALHVFAVVKKEAAAADVDYIAHRERLTHEQDYTKKVMKMLKSHELREICKDLIPVKNYLYYVHRDTVKRNHDDLARHLVRVAKKHKENRSVSIQNTLDSYHVIETLPRDYTDKELYFVEWFISGDLKKCIPAGVGSALIIFIFFFTITALSYFILRGSELSVSQTKVCTILVGLSIFIFAFILEPLKVLLITFIHQREHASMDRTLLYNKARLV